MIAQVLVVIHKSRIRIHELRIDCDGSPVKAERHVASTAFRFNLGGCIRLEGGKRPSGGRVGQGDRAGGFSRSPAQIDTDLMEYFQTRLVGSKGR